MLLRTPADDLETLLHTETAETPDSSERRELHHKINPFAIEMRFLAKLISDVRAVHDDS